MRNLCNIVRIILGAVLLIVAGYTVVTPVTDIGNAVIFCFKGRSVNSVLLLRLECKF